MGKGAMGERPSGASVSLPTLMKWLNDRQRYADKQMHWFAVKGDEEHRMYWRGAFNAIRTTRQYLSGLEGYDGRA